MTVENLLYLCDNIYHDFTDLVFYSGYDIIFEGTWKDLREQHRTDLLIKRVCKFGVFNDMEYTTVNIYV